MPFIVVEEPLHMVEAVTLVPTVGNAFTIINIVAVFVHPAALVPVTV